MNNTKKQRLVRRSAGIACCRYNTTRKCYEILLVKKRCSYNFVSFVLGYYSKKDEKQLKTLFNGMTHAEKVDIISLKYNQLWYHVMLNYPDYLDINSDRMSKGDINAYIRKKNKFESTFVVDGGIKLRSLINGTHNSELLWEIPKGRKSKNELTFDCAMREFKEETNMRSSNYKVITSINPITEIYICTGITYSNKYYVAETNIQTDPRMSFVNPHQISEIEDIKWMNTADISICDPIGRLHKQVKAIFKQYKSYRKRTQNMQNIIYTKN